MDRNRFRIIYLLAATIILVMLVFLLTNQQPRPDLAYDPNPDNLVIYADLRSYPGPPPPDEPCLGQYFPRLRIWGDGLAFLDVSMASSTGQDQWNGELTPTQVHSALVLLQASGFFGSFTPQGPNPAGTSLRLAAHLRSKSVIYESGDLQLMIYTQLIDQIKPYLQPVSSSETYDPRIQNIVDGISGCLEKPLPALPPVHTVPSPIP